MNRCSGTPSRALPALLASSAMLLGSTVLAVPALAAPPEQPVPGSPPTLVPRDGAYLEGVETVTAEPTTADDDVTSLRVDGEPLEAEATYGEAQLSFDVGSNSTEARYGSYLLVNGEHRLDIGDHVDERVTYDVPTTWLTEGENVMEVRVGAVDSSCGSNYDDYDLADVRLDLLGESANGEDNEWSYAFGDGSCGTNTGRVTSASLSFFILEDPTRTTGLTAELDTATLSNGAHDVTATTAGGASTTHRVEVNNAPAGAPRITPQDGVVVRGTQPVFAHQAADAGTGVDTLTVDGEEVPVRPTLGYGDAVFTFRVGSNSIEARYNSFLLVNGQRVDLGGDFASETVDVVIPNEWLMPGANRLRFVTGTFTTSCGANRDDYAISALGLRPAVGTATGQGLRSSYDLGDGSCGSSNKAREAVLDFSVEGPARGLRADLDTATLADGPHTVRASAASGPVATRTLVTDNTAPVVVSSVPVAGDRLTSSTPLALEVEDASGVLGDPAVTLDGEPVDVGQAVGPGLLPGAHVLAVSVEDSLGNRAVREISFTSAGVPDEPTDLSPASGADDVSSPATLEARVGVPGGGPVTARFTRTEILTPPPGWQGESATVPTSLRVPGERNAGDTRALAPGDDRSLDSVASRDVSYQRYDVSVRAGVDSPVLRWEGVIDPTRTATLHAWDTSTRQWEPLAAVRGAEDGSTVLSAGVSDRHVDGRKVHVLVTGEDPFADDLDTTGRDGFDDPSTYDFSMAHFTDTQYLSEGAVEQETAEERAVWEKAYGDVTRWIGANAGPRKISYVAHTGDLIENNIRPPATPEMERQVTGEFEVSSKLQGLLDEAGVVNGVVAGNHDNQSGRENGPSARFNDYFGPERYRTAAQQWNGAEYGGPWREGDNQNHYDLFSAGGLDFVVVGLSYGVNREEAEWADSVFERFPDRNGVLLSHDYLRPSSSPDGRDGTFSAPDGSLLYNTIVEDNPNVFLILAGHEHGVATNVKPDVGVVGNGVVEMLADYQFYEVSAEELGLTTVGGYQPEQGLRFGASFFRLLQFDVARAEMSVDTYSPFLDDFGATEYDTDDRYDGREDTMVLPVDLTSRRTSFSTESLGLFQPTEVVGEQTVPSGELASVTWRDLRPDTAYAWVVTATSPGGGVTSSAPQVFATEDTRGRPSDALRGWESLAVAGESRR